MSPETPRLAQDRWDQAGDLVAQAELLPIAARMPFLADACAGDAALLDLALSMRGDDDTSPGEHLFLDNVDLDVGATRLTRADRGEHGDTVRLRPVSWTGRRLDDRYVLGKALGHGGSSVVFRAWDEVLGEEVAVKVVPFDARSGPDDRPADSPVRREVAMLRHLRLPGVVQLRDDGVVDGHAFVVMDIAHGRPFPGGPAPQPWGDVAPVLVDLVRVVSRMHAEGVVHRDLKPGNALVDDAGRVTIVDAGLSALDRATSASLGFTDGFAPPEQLGGALPDARSDLYSIGAMTVHALTATAPGPRGPRALLTVLTGRPRPTRVPNLPPDVPAGVSALLHRMLSDDPERRPGTAIEVLHALADLGVTRSPRPELSWLGTTAAIDTLVAEARAGRSVRVHGPVGSGRTRLLREAAARLRSGGYAVVWLRHDARLGERDRRRLTRGVRDGLILVIDDEDLADADRGDWIEGLRRCGSVLSAVARPVPGSVALTRLGARDLQVLFHGPERLFRIPSDAAAELHRRSAGRPGRLEQVIDDWLAARICRFDGDRLRIGREALERLRDEAVLPPADGDGRESLSSSQATVLGVLAICGRDTPTAALAEESGLSASAVRAALAELAAEGLADCSADGCVVAAAPPPRPLDDTIVRRCHALAVKRLTPGSPGRLAHVLAVGTASEAVEEAWHAARRAIDRGSPSRALALALEGLGRVEGGDRHARTPLLRVALEAALHLGATTSVEIVLREIETVEDGGADTALLESLARGALAAMGARPGRIALRSMGRCTDDVLEGWRLAIVVRAAESTPGPALQRALAEAEKFARKAGDAGLGAIVEEWRGWEAYDRGEYEAAIAHHIRSADASPSVMGRAAGLAAAAAAAVEIGHFEQARAWATLARDRADEVRNVPRVAQAEVTLRLALGRSDASGLPDIELIEALRVLGVPQLLALGALNEAVIAFRERHLGLAQSLADEAREAATMAGEHDIELLARALSIACGAGAELADIESVLAAAASIGSDGIALQVAALLAADVSGANGGTTTRLDLGCSAVRVGALRREVFSDDEVRQRLGRGVRASRQESDDA